MVSKVYCYKVWDDLRAFGDEREGPQQGISQYTTDGLGGNIYFAIVCNKMYIS